MFLFRVINHGSLKILEDHKPGVSIFGISVPFTPEGNHTNNEYEVFFKYVLQISNLHAHMSA